MSPLFQSVLLSALVAFADVRNEVGAFAPNNQVHIGAAAASLPSSPASPAIKSQQEEVERLRHAASDTALHMSTTTPPTDQDYYSILGVSKLAGQKEIKSAYRNLARHYHPDANPYGNSAEKFRMINIAYEVLISPDLKQQYDRDLARQRFEREESKRVGAQANKSGVGVDSNPPTPGNDLHVELEIPFKVAAFGGEQVVSVRQKATEAMKQIRVPIPPGVGDGNRLRVRGAGSAGQNGGPAGDLHISLRVQPDPKFRREGSEIYSEETISYLDAILGGRIVDGQVTIRVPPGTQPGEVVRLRGNGAPVIGNPYERGDHHVTMNVEIPTKLSQEEEMLINKLKAIRERKKGAM